MIFIPITISPEIQSSFAFMLLEIKKKRNTKRMTDCEVIKAVENVNCTLSDVRTESFLVASSCERSLSINL